MQKNKCLFENRSVLVKYILSFLTVAVFGCITIGLTLFAFSTSELDKVAAQEMSRYTQDVADDLDRQMESMSEVAKKISFKPDLKYSYIEKVKYRDIEVLKTLKQDFGYVPMCDQFFLMYDGVENLYVAPDDVTSLFYVYAKNCLGCNTQEAIDAIYQRIHASDNYDLIRCNNGNLIYCCSIHNNGTDVRKSWLCFVIYNRTIQNRIALIGGESIGSYRLIWNDEIIYGNNSKGEVHASFCTKNGIVVQLLSEKNLPYSRISTYTKVFWIIILAVMFSTCLIAWIAAKKNYNPIKKLVNEFSDKSQNGRNEFFILQDLLTRTIENNRITQEQLYRNSVWLNRQRRKNNEQMLLLALSGKINTQMQQIGEEESFFADERKYAVICVTIDNEYDSNALFAQINELSDRKTEICCAHLPFESLIAIGISCFEQADYQYSITLLSDLLDVCELKVKIGIGNLVDEPDRIPDSLAEALINLNAQNDTRSETENGYLYDEALIDVLFSYANDGQNEAARQVLDTIFAQIDKANPSMLIRSCAYSNVMNAIIRTATQNGMDLSANQLSIVLLYNHPQKIKELISALLSEVCSNTGMVKNAQWDEKKEALFKYIRENFCKYDLCLSELEEKTGLTVRQIEQHMKDEMHMTFKEYLTEIRMEEAKRLLREGTSVNDTSNAVCYMSVSYFIKTFKKCVGVTPAEYKRSVQSVETDQ